MDRFADLMVKDEKTGECFRLDHLIKATVEKIDKDKTTSPEKKGNSYSFLTSKICIFHPAKLIYRSNLHRFISTRRIQQGGNGRFDDGI